MTSEKKSILMCGLGSIGKRHARILKKNFPHDLWALRTGLGQEKNDLGIPELHSWEEVARRRFDCAFITNPTFLHIRTALECARRRMHLFLEKPIDCQLTGLDELLTLVEKNRLTGYVAYPLRFHPEIRRLKERLKGEKILSSRIVCSSWLPDWRPDQDVQKSYSAHRDQGGGVLLDLSHELDLVASLFGEVSKIEGSLQRRGNVTVDAEDFADLHLTHGQGVTQVTLDCANRKGERFVEVSTGNFSERVDLTDNKDPLYEAQLDSFFRNLGNPKIDNNLFEASRLFRQIISFRDGHG